MGQHDEAFAAFLRTIAQASLRLAEDLEATLDEPDLSDERVRDPAQEHVLGRRQAQIVELPALAAEGGMKTSAIADEIEYEVPNTYTALQALARQGIVEQVPDKQPQHWRLARRYRGNSEGFARMARHVRRGEWTTYGDISIAVMGTHKGSRGVGRAAATDPSFPHPHRVLMQHGIISDGWRSSDGGGPEECRRRLEAEGVLFEEDARAAQKHYVAWGELMARDGREAIG